MQYDNPYQEIVKLLREIDVIPYAASSEYKALAKKLLLSLDKGYELVKIKRVIESELITTYGMYRSEINSDAIATEVVNWWSIKR